MRLIQNLLKFFFSMLYHQFAWTYDFVSALVSLGRWQDWVQAALPYLHGRVLEIGFGPGHLQISMNQGGIPAFGLDESQQMTIQASRRLRRIKINTRLSRGYAQRLPFTNDTFDCVAATFPSEYIYEMQSLQEINRVLVPEGHLVILPMAWITGTSLPDRLAAWIFRLSGEAPGKPKPISPALKHLFEQARFDIRNEIIEIRASKVLVIIAIKRYVPGSKNRT